MGPGDTEFSGLAAKEVFIYKFMSLVEKNLLRLSEQGLGFVSVDFGVLCINGHICDMGATLGLFSPSLSSASLHRSLSSCCWEDLTDVVALRCA